MITKISIKKTASYGETPAILETDKNINLIYGLNGTGKTTLSNYLQDKGDTHFSNCSIEGLNGEKVLVYNKKFVDSNFYQNTQRGIFSLNSENKEAKEKIDNATEEIKKLNSQIKNDELKTGFQFDLEKKQEDINLLQSNSEQKTWKIIDDYYGGDRLLEFCLEGKRKSRKLLLDYILKLQKPANKPEKSIEDLKKEAESTQGENAKTYSEDEIKKIEFYFLEIEENNIFLEVIVGNENLQIANLMKHLNNADWVKRGLDYIKEPVKKEDSKEIENEQCPFCQKETISNEVYKQIKDYFDESYQNKITELTELDSKYWNAWQKIKNNETILLENNFIKNRETEFKLLYKNFTEKLNSNWSKINEKIKTPSKVVSLESTILEKKSLNDFFEEIIQEIKTHNLKIKNKQKTKNEIIKIFWEIMRWDYDQTIENHTTQNAKFEKEKSNIETKISGLNAEINEQKKIIQDAQKEMVNIQDAIDTINSELIFFGLDGFSIMPAGEDSYKLKRPNEDVTKFETLSEGEKTAISFLYFLELCKGKEKNDEVATEKIVVIDDPISSLSHMYVFNVAQLIRKNFFNDKYKQVFILTHNLYLFHEFIKYQTKNNKLEKTKLFRIRKNQNKYSEIIEMCSDDVMNDYQSYWQVIKEHCDGKASDSLLANSMRNILEYFFGFIDNEKYNEAIEKLTDGKYSYFLRYINRESHFDRINISDTKEIDPQIFKEAFKKIFEASGYDAHYNRMIK
ncbi:MAG: AAA family ATPase [bacterium]|nr:AAA family ATPase [bacterium]